MRAHKEIVRLILDLRFTISLLKRSPETDRNTWEDEMILTQQISLVNKSGIWHRVIKLIIFHSFNELTCVVTVDLLLYKAISYIPFGQDKAVIKTGNASIQVTHIVWDSIPKFRSNRSLFMSKYDFIYTCYKIKFHWSLL